MIFRHRFDCDFPYGLSAFAVRIVLSSTSISNTRFQHFSRSLSGVYVGPYQTSMKELFWQNSYLLSAANYFHRKSSVIDVWQVLNTPLSKTGCFVNINGIKPWIVSSDYFVWWNLEDSTSVRQWQWKDRRYEKECLVSHY